jgi:hypothetical protein
VLRSRSIPARPPVFDREVLRAALFSHRGGSWPRTAVALARLVGERAGRPEARWVRRPEEALLEALLDRFPGAGPAGPLLAAPAWGPPRFREALERLRQVRWMPPAEGRLDPGIDEVIAALDSGAEAVLLAPVAGDCQALPDAAAACRRADALLLLDVRTSVGSRLVGGGPERHGDLLLLPVDGEPVPSPCPGAILCGAGTEPRERRGPLRVRHGLDCLLASIADEPRLRRVLDPPRPPTRAFDSPLPPPWAAAAAAARLAQAALRAEQRALNAQRIRVNLGNIAGVELIPDPPGFQAASGALPLLTAHRDRVADRLLAVGVPALHELGGWLAPATDRTPACEAVAERALFLPLHPFYSHRDIDTIGEALRRAVLGARPE